MDIDTSAFQGSFVGSSHAFMAPSVNNAQFPGGLMRYHSAPSSVLAGLLDDDFSPASEDVEFAQLLDDGIGSFSSLLDSKGSQQGDMTRAVFPVAAKEEDTYLPRGREHSQFLGTGNTFQTLSQIPLSVISEYGVEETMDNYCGNQVSVPTEATQQSPHRLSQIDGASRKAGRSSDSQVNLFNSGLIRQSSSPAEFFSMLVMEDNSEQVKVGNSLAGSCLSNAEEKLAGQGIRPSSSQVAPSPVSNFTDVNGSSTLSTASSPMRSNALLRQSSSPAGLLSQINLEDFSMVHEKRALASALGTFSAEGMLDRRGFASHAMGGWDDSTAELAMQNFAALGQRKRGRGAGDELLNGLQRSSADLCAATLNNFSPPSSSMPGSIDCVDGLVEDSVLCKARAKRGCATHPRSIAERQRRIKISERMKKLQDLVPNLDKQANTAEMLDEVVEYVRLLQRQVQELSLNRRPCSSCQNGSSSPC